MQSSAREKFLALSLESSRKSYYPKLKAQLAAIRENERHLQMLIDNLPAAIAYVDHKERYVFVNRGYEDLFGIENRRLVGASVESALGPAKYAKIRAYIQSALNGRQVKFETGMTDEHGNLHWYDVSYVPDKSTESVVKGYYVLVIDLTEKKHTESILREKDQLLNEIGRVVKVGAWKYDVKTGNVTSTDEVARIYDYDPDRKRSTEKDLGCYHGENRSKIEHALNEAIEHGKSYSLELEMVSAKGNHKWVRTIGYPVVKDGRVTQVKGSLQDITQEKLSEQEKLINKERFRLLVENAPDAIFVQTNSRFAYLNSAAVNLFGANSAQDLLGSPVVDRFHPEYREGVKRRIHFLNEEKRSVPNLHEVCLKLDGSSVDIEASAIPMNYDGEDGGLVFVRDISGRIRAEKEQLALQAQLNQAHKMEALGTLAGGIAHDFNNILGAVIGYAELCLMDIDDGANPMYQNIESILHAGTRAKELVTQILTFSRAQEHILVPVDMASIVKETLKLLKASLPANIQLESRIETNTKVMADRSQIHQVVMNLCTNAYHAMEETGGRLSVSLELVSLDEPTAMHGSNLDPGAYVRLTVNDSGAGMSPLVMENIFAPYFTTKKMGKGTGLGLAVVHGIIKSHGGGISVQSNIGEGTTFRVLFPALDAIPDDEKETHIPLPRGNETILLVDDEKVLVAISSQLLTKLGYTVTGVTESIEAMQLFRQHPNRFDLVITDLNMPGKTGDQLAREITGLRPELPIILCTGFSERFDKRRAPVLGIRKVIMKPVTIKNLAESVREVLDQADAKT